ncbi:MAG: ATP-binding protein [Ignavibacteriales bacterium]|nr:ATP-binding protein [Ignavibacteriales bacterium]
MNIDDTDVTAQSSKDTFGLVQRVTVFFIYLLILFGARFVITNRGLPFGGGQDIWFISGISMLAFTTVLSPYFVRPRNSLINCLATSLLLWSIDLSSLQSTRNFVEWFRWCSFSLTLITSICASIAIIFQNVDPLESPKRSYINVVCYRLSTTFGKAEVVYTLPSSISIFGFHSSNVEAMSLLGLFWILVVSTKPIEMAWQLVRDISSLGLSLAKASFDGTIERIDSPNIVRVNLNSNSSWRSNTTKMVCLADGSQLTALPLFSQVRDSGLIGTGLCLGKADFLIKDAVPGSVYSRTDKLDRAQLIKDFFHLAFDANIIGFVVEQSTISVIKFEVAGDQVLRSGDLVFCRQNESTVFYQILDASTKEEDFERNPRGMHVVSAIQIGIQDENGGLVKYSWLPEMNTPVFLPVDQNQIKSTTDSPQDIQLGVIPRSSLAVKARFKELLEFHTAILGVTGTGKTELAFDIIRHAVNNKCKVFCVDFTAEYAKRLSDCNPQALGLDDKQNRELDELVTQIEFGQFKSETEKKKLDEYIKRIRPEVEKRVDGFLRPDTAALGIFDLPDIANTRATLRATELYLSAIFSWARKNRKARNILIVLEEAHTIIPELNFFGFDKGDTQVVIGRMAQIALQGRKYGIGLLIVSQRTALVSKTLLSQCNTYLTFSLVDKTSLEYLSSVYSPEMVANIPNLSQIQMLAYGKAVRSERPVIIQIPFDPKKKEASEKLDVKIVSAAGLQAATGKAVNVPPQ